MCVNVGEYRGVLWRFDYTCISIEGGEKSKRWVYCDIGGPRQLGTVTKTIAALDTRFMHACLT